LIQKNNMVKYAGHRVAVLIDTQNLYHSARKLYNFRVNFSEILNKAIEGKTLIRAWAYAIRTKTGEEKFFFEALEKLGIEMRIKDLQEYVGGLKKGDWDVGITVDAIKISTSVDTVVICSGDGDFVPLIEYLQNQGKRVEVIAFGKSTSSKIKEIADEFIDLGKAAKRYLLEKNYENQKI